MWRRDSDHYYTASGGFCGAPSTSFAVADGAAFITKEYGGISSSLANTVSVKPLIGILNQSKYVPFILGGGVF